MSETTAFGYFRKRGYTQAKGEVIDDAKRDDTERAG